MKILISINRRVLLFLKLLPLLLSIPLITSCDKSEADAGPVVTKLKITSAISKTGNYEVELYANDSLFEGYNQLYFLLRKISTNEQLSTAELSLFPLMDMMTMMHSAPFENPLSAADENGLFEGAIVFLMPSTSDMKWTVDVALDEGGNSDTVQLKIPKVVQLKESKKIDVLSTIDDAKYFVSLAQPLNPAVGINELEFVINYRANMMSFPPAADLTIDIEPEMPSMGHGSPNNVNPVYTNNGHYMGKVNFTMTGKWRIHLNIKKEDELIAEDTYFDITF